MMIQPLFVFIFDFVEGIVIVVLNILSILICYGGLIWAVLKD